MFIRGQEDRHTNIEKQTTLDFASDPTLDDIGLVVGRDDTFPGANSVRFALRKRDQAFLVLNGLKKNLDLLTLFDSSRIFELIQRDNALGLVTDIDNHIVVENVDDLALENLVYFKVLNGLTV